MLDCSKQALILYKQGVITGIRPVFIKIEKSDDHPYKGRYVMSFDKDRIHFCELNFFYRYKGSKAHDFTIRLDNLGGFRLDYFQTFEKKFTLFFKDDFPFTFTFNANFEEAHENDVNINEIMKLLKNAKIYQRNKEGLYGQKIISKASQRFTQEIRRTK